MAGTLFVVATPIGHLEDISQRALRVLRDVSVVAAEDTRRTGNLLRHFGIPTRLISLHAHNERRRAESLIDDLREGTFFAKVRYVYDEEEGQLDARPSDAVALAVRTDAPIFVAAPVLDEAGIPADDDAELPSAFAEEPEPEEEESPPAAKAGTATASGGSKLERMEAQLRKAIDEEDYETAARLRDEIARMRSEN